MTGFDRWGPAKAEDLSALVEASLPGEGLPPRALKQLCWGDPDPCVVVGRSSASETLAGGASVVRRQGDQVVGFIRLVVVHPGHRRAGLGRSLLAELEAWARDQGAAELRFGGEAPHYLWPGVDVDRTAALCLAEAAGYLDRGAALNLGCSTHVPVEPPPDGITVDRLSSSSGEQAIAVLELVDAEWPWWEAEVRRALEQGRCFGAFTAEGGAVGVGCHGVNRPGWFGPIGTEPAVGTRGIGTSVLTAVLADMAAQGQPHAEISWIGPVGFYAKAVGATVSHVYRSLAKPA